MYTVKAIGALRVSREGELEGLDLHEHGVSAYPEYALIAAHRGAQPDPVAAPTYVPGALANMITKGDFDK